MCLWRKAYVLQINELPGGKTDDYYTHIANSINDAVSACFSLDAVSIQKLAHNHLQCTMSDRVSINHCVWLKLEELFQHTLLELKCNVHPLDGISNKIRSTLKVYDNDNRI